MNTPLFSIIIPTYNRAHLITKAIESVRGQTYVNWELIIVDDGSTDNTKEVIQKIKDKRIRYFYKKNEERSVARNFGVDKAIGQYIGFLDSDDYFLPQHLQLHADKIVEEKLPIAATYSGNYFETESTRKPYTHLFANNSPIKNLWKYGYGLQNFTLHKDIFQKISINPSLIYMEDLDFLLTLFRSFTILPIYQNTSVVVEHSERSILQRFKKDIIKNGKLNLYSIDTIIEQHFNFLNQYFTKKEIHQRRRKTVEYFIRASIKRLNIFSFFYFVGKYFEPSSD